MATPPTSSSVTDGSWPTSLGLKPGDWVEVRSQNEILATLDRFGRFEGMPFMPEMLQYCGRRFRVDTRAAKACDTVWSGEGRWLRDTVHLEGVRCDGSAHGGCQALCLIWWREAWLKRVSGPRSEPEDDVSTGDSTPVPSGSHGESVAPAEVDVEDLHRLTTLPRLIDATLYRCQNTEVRDFSFAHRWYDPRPLMRVIRSGNVRIAKVFEVLLWAAGNMLRRRLGKSPVPTIDGRCEGSTPSERIEGLEPGDWVEIKSKEEIETTLNRSQKNRGLWFDVEMLPYCGRKMRLLRPVDRIIDESTRAMIRLPNDCWIIEGAVCSGHLSRDRLFCTRKIYPYWREIWFRRAEPPEEEVDSGTELPVVNANRTSKL